MGEKATPNFIKIPSAERVFLFLLFYRWIVLCYIALVAFLGLFSALKIPWLYHTIAITLVYNLVLTAFYHSIFQRLRQNFWLITLDILVCFFLLALTGGWRSPFYFYAFSPILVAVIIREYHGGILAATQMIAFYNLSIFLNDKFTEIVSKGWLETWVANNFSLYLIAIFFAIPSVLMNQLRASYEVLNDYKNKMADTNIKLTRSNKQLLTLQKINLAIQSSLNLKDVLRKILDGLTSEMGFGQALIGLVDRDNAVIGEWLGSRTIPCELYEDQEVPLKEESGIIANAALLKQRFSVSLENLPQQTPQIPIISIFNNSSFEVIPLLAGADAVGVILTGKKEQPLTAEDRTVLSSFANQGAIAIKNALLRKESQEVVVLRERNRIAMEMHDSVVQILSGACLLLDACTRKLKKDSMELRDKLSDVRALLKESLENVRYSIFNLRPPNLQDGLVSCLRRYSREFSRINSLSVNLSVKGDEKPLTVDKERTLYRVLQEALANIAKHSEARDVGIEVEFGEARLLLTVEDNGKGFNVSEALSQSDSGHTLGLLSMKQAAEDFNGNFVVESLSPSGTRISLQLPV